MTKHDEDGVHLKAIDQELFNDALNKKNEMILLDS